MTYSELLHSVAFDNLVPFIVKYHGHDECMAWYKIHYDMLCHMTPHREEGDNATATVSYYIPEEDEKGIEPGHLTAHPMEGDFWEVSLAKELIIAPDVTASLEEIAACCLWHTSFYGFAPNDLKTFHEDIEAQITAQRIKALCGNFLPSKKQLLQCKYFHNIVRDEMKYFREYRFNKTKKGPEDYVIYGDRIVGGRKRRWRMWARYTITLEYNKVISRIGKFIEMLHQGESLIAPPSVEELCKKLFFSKHCHFCSYQTFIDNANERFEYFKELIVKYNAFTYAKLPGCIICISSSSSAPITMKELQLAGLVAEGCEEAQFCVKVDDSLGNELKISVTFYDINHDTQ